MIKATKPIAIEPGVLLRHILEKAHVSQKRLAEHIGIDQSYISNICRGRIGISAEMAKKLGRAFNQNAEFWMNAQSAWELSQADDQEHIKPLAA
jgi:addiction module HigA family antidote